jgi:hypothetical protein
MVFAVATDPRAPGTIYAGSVPSMEDWVFTVSKSTDGGATWAAAGNGLPRNAELLT